MSKIKLKVLREDAAFGKRVKKQANLPRYEGTHIGKKLISMALLCAPKLGLESASQMIALSITSFLAECGLLDLSQVPKSTPSAKCLRNIIFEAAADSALLEQKVCKNSL